MWKQKGDFIKARKVLKEQYRQRWKLPRHLCESITLMMWQHRWKPLNTFILSDSIAVHFPTFCKSGKCHLLCLWGDVGEEENLGCMSVFYAEIRMKCLLWFLHRCQGYIKARMKSEEKRRTRFHSGHGTSYDVSVSNIVMMMILACLLHIFLVQLLEMWFSHGVRKHIFNLIHFVQASL